MIHRGKWQGMLTILRFNWPFYVVATIAGFAATAAAVLLAPSPLSWPAVLAAAGAFYFLVISLGVSHLVYDLSDLYRFRWFARAISDRTPGNAVLCHTGFDETSAILRKIFPQTHWTVLDHFDPAYMTEPSIRRARDAYPPAPGTITSPFDHWNLGDGSADIVLGLLAIHEFREETARVAWLAEARRCLAPGGRIIIVEHLRDLPNFIAFGPGFLHFHSRGTWQRSWEAAGFSLRDEFPITPWVRVFILSP